MEGIVKIERILWDGLSVEEGEEEYKEDWERVRERRYREFWESGVFISELVGIDWGYWWG